MVRKIRDPIHHFIALGSIGQSLLQTREFQRLREIHQLAMTYMVYPAATHKRFEHSLGVMHLAEQIFDRITSSESLGEFPAIREIVPEIGAARGVLDTDRSTLIAAAMLHDIGHLPFSHASEDLLGKSRDHETVTAELIMGEGIAEAINVIKPYVKAEEIAKSAVKPTALKQIIQEPLTISNWEGILSEIIMSDIVGADRMDYLLRDAYHAGVAYGSFDVYRLIDGIRLLVYPETDDEGSGQFETEPMLGITEGTVHVAEQLQIARYLMFTQVYFHKTRVAYDLHLVDFLKAHLEDGLFPRERDAYLSFTDSEVLAALRQAVSDKGAHGHDAARRIANREHFRLVHSVTVDEAGTYPLAGEAIEKELQREFDPHLVKHQKYGKPKEMSLPVLKENGEVVPIERLSMIFQQTPIPRYSYVYVAPEIRDDATKWLKSNRLRILQNEGG